MAANWMLDETNALLDIWSTEDIQQQLDGTCRNNLVYRQMSQRLAAKGYKRNAQQIKEKIKRLKKDYRCKIKFKTSRSNVNGENTNCPYYYVYEKLDKVIESKPLVINDILSEDDNDDIDFDENNDGKIIDSTPDSGMTPSAPISLKVEPLESSSVENSVSPSKPATAKSSSTARKRKYTATAKIKNILNSMMTTFLEHEKEVEKRFVDLEEKRFKVEMESRERMQREDRDYELRLFQMLTKTIQELHSQTISPTVTSPDTPTTSANFENSITAEEPPIPVTDVQLSPSECLPVIQSCQSVASPFNTSLDTTSNVIVPELSLHSNDSVSEFPELNVDNAMLDGRDCTGFSFRCEENSGGNWNFEETYALIKIWATKEIQKQLDGASRNYRVFEQVAQQMMAHGFRRTAKQSREKLKRMKREYNYIKNSNTALGKQKRTWPFYNMLAKVFEKKTCEDSMDSERRKFDDSLDDPEITVEYVITNNKSMHVDNSTISILEDDSIQEESFEDTTNTSAPSKIDSIVTSPTTSSSTTCTSETEQQDKPTDPLPSKQTNPTNSEKSQDKFQDVISTLMMSFLEHEREAERRFAELEEKRFQAEMDSRERLQRDNRAYEMRLFQMLTQSASKNKQDKH